MTIRALRENATPDADGRPAPAPGTSTAPTPYSIEGSAIIDQKGAIVKSYHRVQPLAGTRLAIGFQGACGRLISLDTGRAFGRDFHDFTALPGGAFAVGTQGAQSSVIQLATGAVQSGTFGEFRSIDENTILTLSGETVLAVRDLRTNRKMSVQAYEDETGTSLSKHYRLIRAGITADSSGRISFNSRDHVELLGNT
jgi:hypothetical protein